MARPRLALALVLALVGAALLSLGAAAAPDRYILPGDNVFPEGIATSPDGRTFYAGSTTSGAVFRGDVESGAVEVFLPGGSDGRTDVRGLKAGNGRLYLAGGPTGQIFVYDIATKRLLGKFATGLTPTFVNDATIAPDGAAYFTDSNSPAIYRVAADPTAANAFERWIDLTGSPIVYAQGFNLNGIAASADGRYLVTVQSNTGKLFRIEIATKRVTEIDLGGQTVMGGDGLLIAGNVLHVMRNSAATLVTLRPTPDYASATLVTTTTNPAFDFPTTFAPAGDRLLVVNSQLNKRQSNTPPVLPFVILNIAAPGAPQPTPTATIAPTAPTPPPTPTPAVMPGLPNTGGGAGEMPFGLPALVAALLVALASAASALRARRRA